MRAEILFIGTEILLGEILDSNSRFIASRLPALGIDLYHVSQVGDNLGRLTEVLGRAWGRSDLVITTGGLGPTEDDLTREAIAQLLGEEPSVDPQLEAWLRTFFASRGYPMPERNIKQAWLIASARAIPNPRGTAPGWWVEREGKLIVAMPGPPTEMAWMWEREVAPELERRSTGTVLLTRTLKTAGIGEGSVDEMLSPLLRSTNPTIGVYARPDGVHVRLAAKAPDRPEAASLLAPLEDDVRAILGAAVWGVDDEALEEVCGRLLRERGLTLATMESCTGGLLADTITNVPGASHYYRGGYVAYATEQKIAWGVSAELVALHTVVSEEVAREMARAAREGLGADIGIGISGVAGPDPQEGVPVGTVHVGLHDGRGSHHMGYALDLGREAIKRRAVTTALLLLRRTLLAG